MSWRQEGVSPWHVMQAGEGGDPGPVTFNCLLALCALPGVGSSGLARGSPRAGREQDWDGLRTQTEGPVATKSSDSWQEARHTARGMWVQV